jgi:hypothetical protein
MASKGHTHLFNFFKKSSNLDSLLIIFESSILSQYIQDERATRGFDTSNITIETAIYAEEKKNKSSLLLVIKKDGADLLHLAIQLAPNELNLKYSGMIYIYKSIHRILYPNSTNEELYVPILVKQIPDKSQSLQFSINNPTTNIHTDIQLDKEIDVILTVLNRLFDETDEEYYININMSFTTHNKKNIIYDNIHRHVAYVKKLYEMKLASYPVINNAIVDGEIDKSKLDKWLNRKTLKVRKIKFNTTRNRYNNKQNIRFNKTCKAIKELN